MVIATMESEHYSWLAVGNDEQEARDALIAVLRAHGQQPGNEEAWVFSGMDPDPEAALEYYCAKFSEIELGQGLRDGSPIT